MFFLPCFPLNPPRRTFCRWSHRQSATSSRRAGSSSPPAVGAKDAADLNLQAKKGGVPIVLSCGISASDTQLAVSLEWRDLQKPSPPTRVDRAGPLDLTLDSVILKVIDSLIGSVSPRADELIAARAAAARAAGAAAAPPRRTRRYGRHDSRGHQADPPARGGHARSARRLRRRWPHNRPPSGGRTFAMDYGVAPFVPVGAASLYFPIGVLPSIDARMVFPTSSGRFALGLHAAAVYFQAVGSIDTAQDLLVPVGVDVRYEIGSGAPLLFFAHFSGGPALLFMATASQGTFNDLTAYFQSGIGASFMFSPRLGLSVMVDYEVYFEVPYLIMGFVPSVALSWKL